MNQITCLADAINHTPRVRVIKEGDENYGKEFDIKLNNYDSKNVVVEDIKLISYPYSYIQFLTPVQYYGRYIGLGDKVNDREVYGYSFCGEWVFDTTRDYNKTLGLAERDIYSFEPLHKLTPKIELSTEEMLEELKRRGVVTSGNILNN